MHVLSQGLIVVITIAIVMHGSPTLADEAAPVNLPFLWVTDPEVAPASTNIARLDSWLANARKVCAILPTGPFTRPLPRYQSYRPYAGSSLEFRWPEARTTTMTVDYDGHSPARGTVRATGTVFGGIGLSANLSQLREGESRDAYVNRLHITPETRLLSQSEGTILFRCTGGRFNDLRLKCTAYVLDGQYGIDGTGVDTTLCILADWGDSGSARTDERAVRQVVELRVGVTVSAQSDYPSVLSHRTVCATLLGTDTVREYAAPVFQQLVNAFTAGRIWLEGAPPENLLLYDMSTSRSLNAELMRRGASWSGTFPEAQAMNQYDVGISEGLPLAGRLAPFTAGGNACGPMSLELALYWAMSRHFSVQTVYSNVMTAGWPQAAGIDNRYDYCSAEDWINGLTQSHVTKHFFDPRIFALPEGFRFTTVITDKPDRFEACWRMVERTVTTRRQPVLLRTDLGGSSHPGGGHIILLVGMGRSEYVAQAYGTSGDYYIVADPAGHYFANPGGTHYGRVKDLMAHNLGINRGGWYAIYPKELVRSRIHSRNLGKSLFAAQGFSLGESIKVNARSPISLAVIDFSGRRTGIINGVTYSEIPNAIYQEEWAEEEGDGDGGYVPDGVKSVVVLSPSQGTYSSMVTGTGSGSYDLDWSYSGGTTGFSGSTAGAISPGGQRLQVLGVVPPVLTIRATASAIDISWTTNTPNLRLQAKSAVNSTVWRNLDGTPAISDDMFVLTEPLAAEPQFFRLVDSAP